MPEKFVFLDDIDPNIRQDIRYASSNNFMQRPLNGYVEPRCILTLPAAKALSKVHKAAQANGLGLVVFDCYRPMRAVRDMVSWARDSTKPDADYYPDTPRDRLVATGYIGSKSAHARGSTVDVALFSLTGKQGREPQHACSRRDNTARRFGTPFDCFHILSQTKNKQVSRGAQQARNLLLKLMTGGGFRNYPREWWHFTLRNEPFPNRAFDFPVVSGN